MSAWQYWLLIAVIIGCTWWLVQALDTLFRLMTMMPGAGQIQELIKGVGDINSRLGSKLDELPGRIVNAIEYAEKHAENERMERALDPM